MSGISNIFRQNSFNVLYSIYSENKQEDDTKDVLKHISVFFASNKTS